MRKYLPPQGLLVACVPPIGMAVLLNRWWLLLLLMPATAYLSICGMTYLAAKGRCLRCGIHLDKPDESRLCPACDAIMADRTKLR